MIKSIGQWRSQGASANAQGYYTVFKNACVIAFGIQGPHNLKFRVNGGSLISIGSTGLYELDLQYLNASVSSLEILYDEALLAENQVIVDYIEGV